MSLLDFARGPALETSLIIFALGVTWRLVGVLLLPWRLIPAEPRAGAPSPSGAALRAVIAKMWPYPAFQNAFVIWNGYVFHVGLAIVVFLGAPHVLFIRSLTGLSWHTLPDNVIGIAGAITLASLVAALVHRLRNPVLRVISRPDDYITWAVTTLPVLTGLMAAAHVGARYETLLAWHFLSLCVFFIWFPFGRLMHAFMFFASRGLTGVRMGRRGAAI